MSLFNNKYIQFSFYRDADLEAFYDIDSKYRRSIIFSHMMIHFLPVLLIMVYFWAFVGDELIWQVLSVTLVFYALIIIETTAYLFPSTRKVFKRYLPWFFVPLIIIGGFFGYIVGLESFDAESGFNEKLAFIIGVFGGFGMFIWTYMGMSLILKASRAIYSKKAEIEADVRFATEVQERILEDVSIEHHLSKAYAASVPANELGGDFFELSRHDESFFACIGDVSGHSFGAGLLMTMTKSALQTHLEYNHNPSDVIGALNGMFLKQSDRAMYATMCLLKLDLSTQTAKLCNAGHLPILHYMKEEGEFEYRYKKGLGLGMINKANYENLEFSVNEGDLLFLYSDGLIETRDEESKIRDADFFEQIIKRSVEQPFEHLSELLNLIYEDVEAADSSDKFEDDATLIIIEV